MIDQIVKECFIVVIEQELKEEFNTYQTRVNSEIEGLILDEKHHSAGFSDVSCQVVTKDTLLVSIITFKQVQKKTDK
jgi:hypothetical protein